ncbi:MAG: thiamine phosphate synthase [Chitinophagales bacterium]
MKYIVQTLPYEVFKEADKINKLFQMGLDVLHIRKPLYSRKEIKQLLLDIDEEFHSKIVLHSHFSLLASFHLQGIHLDLSSVKNIFKKSFYSFLKRRYNISISISSNKILKNKFEDSFIDYIFLGPVFVKYSEESIVQKINAFEFKKYLQETDKKIFASGCFNLKNIIAINSLGFSGSVLQSYIWKSDDILNAFKTLTLNNNQEFIETKEIAI